MLKTFNVVLKFVIVILCFVSNKIFAYEIKHLSKDSYLGIGMLISKMNMENDYGQNVFAKTNQGINLSVGKMFNKHFGIEIGFEPTNNKYRQAIVNAPDNVLGLPVLRPYRFEFYNTTLKKPKYYLGLVSRLYINDTSFINLIAGAALIKYQLNSTLVSNYLVPNFNMCRHFHTNRILPMLKLEFEKIITNNLGIKASLGWINSNKVQINSIEQSNLLVKLKNTTDFSLGIKYYL